MTFTVRKSRLKSGICLKRVEDMGEISVRQVSSWELAVDEAIKRH